MVATNDASNRPRKQRQPRTDSIEIYPAGRGKIVAITKKSIPPKPKSKHDPRFVHFWIRSNPDNIALVEYLTKDSIKRVYLFGEEKQLSYEERLKLAASLIVSLSRYLDKSETWKHTRVVINNELRKEANRQLRRYVKWRRKQQ